MLSGEVKFKNNFPEEYDKLQRDNCLSVKEKENFYNDYDSCLGDDSPLDCATSYFRGHQCIGCDIALLPSEVLGRFVTKVRFIDFLGSNRGYGAKSVNRILSLIRSLPKHKRIERLRKHFRRFDMGQYLLWAYRNAAEPSDPFSGLDAAYMPCRLGLDANAGDIYVAWGIGQLRSSQVSGPTAFDAGIGHMGKWEPGGFTKPDSSCSSMTGLPEVVLRPPSFRQLAVDFLEVKAR